jgi:uncharacterized SAM-binding protein YcdF (DUF218 family)
MSALSTILSDLANAAISLRALFLLLVVAVLLVWRSPTRRATRLWLTVVVVVYGILAVPLVPYAASGMLDREYEPLSAAAAAQNVRAIVLLGAGTQIIQGRDQQLALLDGVGAGRVLEAARIYRAAGQPWIISSGGTHRPDAGLSSAAMMRLALIQLGVDPARIVLETASLTTRDEAVLIAPMLRALQVDRFALVTTRSHMRRSMSAFAQQALTPIPAVVPDGFEHADWSNLLTPDAEGLRLSHALFHEVLGMAYYRLRGWTAG